MAAKRSPISGYNHNVRYRGVIFHVQTEDSGLSNPHVFTHLFHGGVIISTRKLVYDPGSSEEAVKSLMQSQHKAALRDLKSGAFDDKIDVYLAGTPGLLARGSDDSMVAGVSTRAATQDDASPALSRAPTETVPDEPEPEPEPVKSKVSVSSPTPPAGNMPPIPARASGVLPVMAPASRQTQPRSSAMAAPVVVTKVAGDIPENERREVSQAFKAMQLEEDVAEVHSPAPASVAVPPGAVPSSPGEYAQHRRRGESVAPPVGAAPVAAHAAPAPAHAAPAPAHASPAAHASAATPPPVPTAPAHVHAAPAHAAPPPTPAHRREGMPPPTPQAPGTHRGAPAAAPRPGDVVRARPPTPGPRAPTVQGPPQPQRIPGVVSAGAGPAVPRVVTPPAVGRSGTPPQRSRPPTGGVVMSKPAVIVGAPPKVIGGGPSGATAAPASPGAAASARTQTGRVRKAREESEGGMFGQDLISEKSLDEVILAYLSEDGSEE